MDSSTKKTLIILVSALILAVVAVIVYSGVDSPENTEETQQAEDRTNNEDGQTLSNEATCEEDPSYTIVEEDFTEESRAGEAEVAGDITTDSFDLFGEQYMGVYLAVNEDEVSGTSEEFYNHYLSLAEGGNTINTITGDNTLLFKLGLLDDGDSVSTTSNISELARVEIESRLAGQEEGEISLALQIPDYIGSEPPANFSFACSMKIAE